MFADLLRVLLVQQRAELSEPSASARPSSDWLLSQALHLGFELKAQASLPRDTFDAEATQQTTSPPREKTARGASEPTNDFCYPVARVVSVDE